MKAYLDGKSGDSGSLDSFQQELLKSPPVQTSENQNVNCHWAMETMLQSSIYEFGSASFGSSAHDVYEGVFRTGEQFSKRTQSYQSIRVKEILLAYPFMVSGFPPSQQISRRLISLILIPTTALDTDTFEFEFKSVPIGLEIIKQIEPLSLEDAKDLVLFCRFSTNGSTFSSHVFKTLAHYSLAAHPSAIAPVSEMFTMARGSTDENVFEWIAGSIPDDVCFRMSQRTITRVDFNSSDLSLDAGDMGKKYFAVTSQSNPCADSFVVNFDSDRSTITIWLFKITLVENYVGSEEGYAHIRTIVSAVRQCYPTQDVCVQHVLVVPNEGGEKRTWTMPDGRAAANTGVRHEDVRCLFLDVTVRSSLIPNVMPVNYSPRS